MIKKKLKSIITNILLLVFKWFRINTLSTIGIDVKTTSSICKSKMDGHISIKTGIAIYSSDIKGNFKAAQNSKISGSIFSGNITIYENVHIDESNINGTVSLGNNSKLYQSTINGSFVCDKMIELYNLSSKVLEKKLYNGQKLVFDKVNREVEMMKLYRAYLLIVSQKGIS